MIFGIQRYTEDRGWEYIKGFEFDNIADTVETINDYAKACRLDCELFGIKIIN